MVMHIVLAPSINPHINSYGLMEDHDGKHHHRLVESYKHFDCGVSNGYVINCVKCGLSTVCFDT